MGFQHFALALYWGLMGLMGAVGLLLAPPEKRAVAALGPLLVGAGVWLVTWLLYQVTNWVLDCLDAEEDE